MKLADITINITLIVLVASGIFLLLPLNITNLSILLIFSILALAVLIIKVDNSIEKNKYLKAIRNKNNHL